MAGRLLLDENLSPRLASELSGQFPGSVHERDVQLKGQSDQQIWSFAADNGHAIVTKDDDFRHCHRGVHHRTDHLPAHAAQALTMALPGISNANEFYSAHYLKSVLTGDIEVNWEPQAGQVPASATIAAHLAAGRYNEAIPLLRTRLQLEPDHVESLYNLGEAPACSSPERIDGVCGHLRKSKQERLV